MNIRTELFRDKLPNVAPYCTIEVTDWIGSQSGEVLATGDGTTVDFSGKVDLPPVNPLDSFVLHYTIGGTAYSVQADANGNFSDANVTGSVAQDGTWNATFNTAPDDAIDITADYSYGIPPANLENALDPSNPNPSDWGWKTTTGAGTIGEIEITLPEEGYYLILGRGGFHVISSSETVSIVLRFRVFDTFNNSWRDGVSLIDTSTSGYSQEDFSPAGLGYFNKFRLRFYVYNTCEIKVRIDSFGIFKIS